MRAEASLSHYFSGLGLAWIAAHLLAAHLPIEWVWGAGGFPMLPGWTQWLLAGMAVALLIGPGARWLGRVLGAAAQVLERPPRWLPAAAALLSLPVTWFTRLGHTRWGDAYIFANAISHPEVRLTYNWQSPMDLWLHAKGWALANQLWGWDVQTTYAVGSCLAGAAFVYLLLSTLDAWGPGGSERLLAVVSFLTLGTMQLFFGYVESYTIIPVTILAMLVLGFRFVQGRGRLWPVATVLAVTLSLTLSTLPLLVGLAYLAWHALRSHGWSWGRVVVQAAAPLLLVAAIVVGVMTAGGHGLDALVGRDRPGGGDRSWFVPLRRIETKWQHYTMLSPTHLREIANQQWLIAPFGVTALLGTALLRRRRVAWRSPEMASSAACALAYLALTVVWNPDYGGRRDWDLFACAALPLTAWAALAVTRATTAGERLAIARTVLVVGLMHLAPWVWFNHQPWPWD